MHTSPACARLWQSYPSSSRHCCDHPAGHCCHSRRDLQRFRQAFHGERIAELEAARSSPSNSTVTKLAPLATILTRAGQLFITIDRHWQILAYSSIDFITL